MLRKTNRIRSKILTGRLVKRVKRVRRNTRKIKSKNKKEEEHQQIHDTLHHVHQMESNN